MATRPIKEPGAMRAAPGEYAFEMAKINNLLGGPDYSTVYGSGVEGDRMIAALMRMPAGTALPGARDRASAHKAKSSLDEWAGRADEPYP
jgi:hypothetical protein